MSGFNMFSASCRCLSARGGIRPGARVLGASPLHPISAAKGLVIPASRSILTAPPLSAGAPRRPTLHSANAASLTIRTNTTTPSTSSTSTPVDPATTTATSALRRTPLYLFHISNGARMVPFANYAMPLLYPKSQSHIASHQWTREHASLFDVSHMVQHHFSGPGALAFLESLTPADLGALQPYSSTLSVLLAHPTGGIMDDCMITMLASQEHFYVVTNAGCREKDLEYFSKALHKWELDGEKRALDVVHKVLNGWGLIALQGPEAKFVLEEYLRHVVLREDMMKINLDDVVFGHSFLADVPASDRVGDRVQVHIARGGYTGEDGFEISIPAGRGELGENGDNPTTYITKELLRIGGEGRVKLAGLAARDSLRLEAGLCLYGHDLTEEITPPEASLAWVVARRRRAEAGFPGAGIICNQLSKGGTGPRIKRVGLDFGTGGPPAREGMKLFVGGKEAGKVTSGGPAISLGMKNIAMGYVEKGCDKVGSEVEIDIRGKRWPGKVVKMPFVETKYWRGVPKPEPKEEITGEVNQE